MYWQVTDLGCSASDIKELARTASTDAALHDVLVVAPGVRLGDLDVQHRRGRQDEAVLVHDLHLQANMRQHISASGHSQVLQEEAFPVRDAHLGPRDKSLRSSWGHDT